MYQKSSVKADICQMPCKLPISLKLSFSFAQVYVMSICCPF